MKINVPKLDTIYASIRHCFFPIKTYPAAFDDIPIIPDSIDLAKSAKARFVMI